MRNHSIRNIGAENSVCAKYAYTADGTVKNRIIKG
jgi:hypothetical protein